eukprot:TRINITY_DN1827_c0_g1_i1.p1 TRINITY_DN1827_c0_g1~~TRINITY_DN1827_c0_g1_i1.p1  ORF type:complete len:542 (-),score=66.99 TRINITY_DN1827_c0_g1_i1:602-2227(-)
MRIEREGTTIPLLLFSEKGLWANQKYVDLADVTSQDFIARESSTTETRHWSAFANFKTLFVDPESVPIFSGCHQATCYHFIPSDPPKIVIGYYDGDVVYSQQPATCGRNNLSFTLKSQVRMRGHVSKVTCVSSTSDSSMIISGSLDCTLRIWNAITSAPISVFPFHTPIMACATTQQNVAAGFGDGMTFIWDLKACSTNLQVLFPNDLLTTSLFLFIKNLQLTEEETSSQDKPRDWYLQYENCTQQHPCSSHLCKLLERACTMPSGWDFSMWALNATNAGGRRRGRLPPLPRFARYVPTGKLEQFLSNVPVSCTPRLSHRIVVNATTCVEVPERSFGVFTLQIKNKPCAKIWSSHHSRPYPLPNIPFQLICKHGLGLNPFLLLSRADRHPPGFNLFETLSDLLLLEIFQHLTDLCLCPCHRGQVFVGWAVHSLCTLDLVCKRFSQPRLPSSLSLTEEAAKLLCLTVFGIQEKLSPKITWKKQLSFCGDLSQCIDEKIKLMSHLVLVLFRDNPFESTLASSLEEMILHVLQVRGVFFLLLVN